MFCGQDFYRKLTEQSSMSSNCRYVASSFLKIGEVIVEYVVYTTIFGFSMFCFYYLFKKLFLFQSKTKINWKIKWKKFRVHFCKNANFWIFGTLTVFFWNFYGKLELVKAKNVPLEVTVFCGQFYQEVQLIDETFWYINDKPCISK